MKARPALVLLVALAALPPAACGSSDAADDASAVAGRFQAALARGDGKDACAELGEETLSKLEEQEKRPCDRAILDLDLPAGGTAQRARVYVTSASVALTSGGTMFLDEAADGWEISAAGCRPTTDDLPYACELEG